MIDWKTKCLLLLLLLVELFLLNTRYTDADIFAERTVGNNHFSVATLSFGQNQTANNFSLQQLFRTVGLIPGGFDVGSVRIQKQGRLTFKYHVSVVKKNGSDSVCNALQLKVMQKNEWKYQGKLLNYSYDSTVTDQTPEDYIFFISIGTNDSSVMNGSCDFNFRFRTYRNQPNETGGLFDQKELMNSVTTGKW